MLTKRLFSLGILLLLVTSLTLACAPAPKAAPAPAEFQPVTLKLHTGWAAGHYLEKVATIPFIEGVQKRTNGKVTIELYSANQLVKTEGLYEAVKTGVVDITNTAYIRGATKLQDVIRLPFSFDSNNALLKAWPEIEPLLQPEQEAQGLRILYPIYVVPQHIWNSVRPIKTTEDLKGLKIIASEYAAKMIGTFGAATVAIPSPDRYETLQRRTVDGMTYSATSTFSLKFYEVLKYGTICHIAPEGAPFYINLNTWKKLPKDIQQIMMDEGLKAAKAECDYVDAQEEKNIAELEKLGMQIYRLPSAERNRWKEAAAPIWDEFVKGSGDPQTAQKLVNILRKAQ